MLTQREVRRESNIFPPPRLHPDDIARHGKTIDKCAYASQHQKNPRSVAYGKELPSITPVKVFGHNRWPQQHVAPKDSEVSYGQPVVCSPREAMACRPNAQGLPRMIPPRFLEQQAAQRHVGPLMGRPNIGLDYSPFPKQLGIPVSSTGGPSPHCTTYSTESIEKSSSPLLSCHNPQSPEPKLDIKAALSAQGIHIGIPSSTSHPQPPTDRVELHPHIDQPILPTPLTPAALMSHRHDNPCGQDSPQPLRVDRDVNGRVPNCPNTSSEPPKRPPGLQSPAVRRDALKPAPLVHVNLPPSSKAKEMTCNARCPKLYGPEISVVGPETVTIIPDAPEPPILPITSSSVKLPPVQERLQPSSLPPTLKESSSPMQSNTAMDDTRSSSASGKDEMCRKWFVGLCDKKRCYYAHRKIPSNLTCHLWLLGKCTRSQCPFVHEHQGSHDPAIQIGDTQEVVDRDSSQPASSGTSRSAESMTPVPSATESRDTQRASQVASNNGLSECAQRKTPSKPDGPHTKQVCRHGLRGRCKRSPCPCLTERPPNDNISTTNTPTSSSSSSPTIVRNTHTDDVPASRNPQTAPGAYPAKPGGSKPKQLCHDWSQGRCMRSSCIYLHERPPNDNTLKTNTPSSSSSSSPTLVRNTHADDAPTPRNPHPVQKPIPSNSLSRNPPPSLPSPTTRRNDDVVIPMTISDHITVKLQNGFEVKDVITGFETRWVHIGDVSPHIKESQLRPLLEEYGEVELYVPDGKGAKRLTIKAQYPTAAQAMKASIGLQGRQFQGRKLTAKLPLNTTARGTTVLRDTAVRITWNAPQRVGYAGYATLDEAKAAIATATGFVMKDNVLTAALYEGLPAVGVYSVMFSHLPADAERKDLEQFGNAESIVFERPNYQSLDGARNAVLRMLRSCGNLSNLDLALPIRNGLVLAWATFETHADASNARDHLDGQYPRAMEGKTYVSARHVQSLNFSLPLSKFKMLEGDITRLRWSWRTRFHHDVTLVDRFMSPDGPVHIRISAENLTTLGIAKAEFEQLQHGEVVTLQKKPIWDRFFSQPSGQLFLRELESRYPGIALRTRMGKIMLLGPIGHRQLARRDIMTRFQELQARQRWPIPLSGKMVGPFVGTDLLTLQKSLGPENCYVQHLSNQRVLVVRGNEQAYRIACEAVEKVQSRYADSSTPSPQSVCPVCFTEASVPALLSCGHSWCASCLESYLMSAVENKTFPLTCLGDDASCTERISLPHAKKILSGDDFAALCEASFWSYVHTRTDEFHHCPTPDCAQVYRAAPASTILQCPSCLVRICSGCHAEAHDGITCEERDAAEDKLFHEWAATHDVKNCPGCKTPIERSEGCNHMTCTRCQTHICWECLATFPKGDGIYEHMRHKHGGIGVEFL